MLMEGVLLAAAGNYEVTPIIGLRIDLYTSSDMIRLSVFLLIYIPPTSFHTDLASPRPPCTTAPQNCQLGRGFANLPESISMDTDSCGEPLTGRLTSTRKHSEIKARTLLGDFYQKLEAGWSLRLYRTREVP